jgi:probable F420-dependent oxidoreductase
MRLGFTLSGRDLLDVARLAREAEDAGVRSLWSTEGAHNPFLPLMLAAEHTRTAQLGTAISVAFARSPVVTAHIAWDLQRASRGRFVLGLGTQVKAHVERRFGMPYTSPGPRLRDAIRAIRAVWECWETRGKLDYQGEFYRLSLMTPVFSPPPLDGAPPRVFVSAVNAYNCRTVGELADGMNVHPFHSVRYLRQFVLPNVEAGLARSGRTRRDVCLAAPVFVVTGRTADERRAAREAVRRRIAFYGSTRTYQPVLEAHGWSELSPRLHEASMRGDWTGMASLITDEMLGVYAVEAGPDEVGAALRERCEGLVDEVVPDVAAENRWDAELFSRVARAFASRE